MAKQIKRPPKRREKAQGRISIRVPPSNTALIIVDVQQEFPIPSALVRKIEAYSRQFTCRIFTRFVNPSDSFFRRKLKIKCCAPGSIGTKLLIAPSKDDIVLDKDTYGLAPRQIRQIKARGITRVVVCGLETDACVLGIMYSLFDSQIHARVEPSLCWSSTGLHREALEIIAMQFEPP
ncbi:MAG TPA: isochorismatase family protein [Opitutaceae bacterium]|nr:isochorismatase family protein [Opitutaceae bacterium]